VTDEQLRIRGYLQAQGAKLAPSELVEKVRAAMGQVREAVMAVPAARFSERPANDEWSANEVMAHVVTAGDRFAERITGAIDGHALGTPVADAIEHGAPERTADEWWSTFAAAREALFARVLHADPAAHPERVIEHPFFGGLNWREAMLFLRLHDLDHAGQLGKIAAALSRSATGSPRRSEGQGGLGGPR
jgi:uncharacterized damage-inducible protein DinB